MSEYKDSVSEFDDVEFDNIENIDIDDIEIDDIEINDADIDSIEIDDISVDDEDIDDIEIEDLDNYDLSYDSNSEIEDYDIEDTSDESFKDSYNTVLLSELKKALDHFYTIEYGSYLYWSAITIKDDPNPKEVSKYTKDQLIIDTFNSIRENLMRNDPSVSDDYCIFIIQINNAEAFLKNNKTMDENLKRQCKLLIKRVKIALGDSNSSEEVYRSRLSECTDNLIASVLLSEESRNDFQYSLNLIEDYRNKFIKANKTNLIQGTTPVKKLISKLSNNISVIDSLLKNPDNLESNITTIKSLQFMKNGLQRVKCSCGNCIDGEDLIVKFYTPQESFNANNNIEFNNIIPELVEPNSVATEDKLTISEFSMGSNVIRSCDGIAEHLNLNTSVLEEKTRINNTLDPSITPTGVLLLVYCALVDFNLVKCDKCGKYLTLTKDDMRFFSAYHYDKVISGNMSQRKYFANNFKIKNDSVKTPTIFRYKSSSLQEDYNSYLDSYKNNIAKYSEDIQNLTVYRRVLSDMVNDVVELSSDTDAILDKLTETAWNFVANHYDDIDFAEQKVAYNNTTGYEGKSCSDGYYPYINLFKIILKDYVPERLLNVRYLSKYFVSPQVNPRIYYGLLVRKCYNNLMYAIDITLAYMKMNGSGDMVYITNQNYERFFSDEDSLANNMESVFNLYKEFDNICGNYIKRCSISCYTYKEFKLNNYHNPSDCYKILHEIADIINNTYKCVLSDDINFIIYNDYSVNDQYNPTMKFDLGSLFKDIGTEFSNFDWDTNGINITNYLTNAFNWRMCCVVIMAVMLNCYTGKDYMSIFPSVSVSELKKNKNESYYAYNIYESLKSYTSSNTNKTEKWETARSIIDIAHGEDRFGSAVYPSSPYDIYDHSMLKEYPCTILPSEFKVMYENSGSAIPYNMIMDVLNSENSEQAVRSISSNYYRFCQENKNTDNPEIVTPEICMEAVSDICNYVSILNNTQYLSTLTNSLWCKDKYIQNEFILPNWCKEFIIN